LHSKKFWEDNVLNRFHETAPSGTSPLPGPMINSSCTWTAFRPEDWSLLSVSQNVVSGPRVVPDGSPGGPRRSAGGIRTERIAKSVSHTEGNEKYTDTCLC
jgi:hypothetical protein